MLDFIGIGTQKAGTTWVHKQMRRHPGVSVPKLKEQRYFCGGVLEHDLAWYLSQWPQGDPADAVRGEWSPDYAPLPESVIAEVARLCPGAKILLTIRHPVEQVWAHYRVFRLRWTAESEERMAGTVGRVDAFEYTTRAFNERYADYGAVLDRWGGAFGADAVHITRFEDIRFEPELALHQIWDFLGVERITLDDEVLNAAVNRSPEHPIPAALRAALSARWLPRVRELNDRLDGGVSAWVDDLTEWADERVLARFEAALARRRAWAAMNRGILPQQAERWEELRTRLAALDAGVSTPSSAIEPKSGAERLSEVG